MSAKGLVCEMQMQDANMDNLSQLRDHGHMLPRYFKTAQMKVNKAQTSPHLSTLPLFVISSSHMR